MGYTHYWSGSAECDDATWNQIIVDLRRVIARKGIPIAGTAGTGKPAFNSSHIAFNGKAPQDYETFSLHRRNGVSEFCKTQYRPYDIIVCAALIIAKGYLPNLKVSSDGGPEEWAEAIELCNQVLGHGVYPCGDEGNFKAPSVPVGITPKVEPEKEPEFKRSYPTPRPTI